jgi:hypothetical protein
VRYLAIAENDKASIAEQLRALEGCTALLMGKPAKGRRKAGSIKAQILMEVAAPEAQSGICTYFIQGKDTLRIKIGRSTSIVKRLGDLRAAEELTLVGYKEGDFEAVLHERFAQWRSLGEWFEPAVELLDYIKDLQRHNRTVAPADLPQSVQ